MYWIVLIDGKQVARFESQHFARLFVTLLHDTLGVKFVELRHYVD